MESININSNINLYYIPMTKLKTTTIDVYIHRDLNEEESSLNALLPYVLKRGCRLCSDSEAISKYLENLYGAGVGVAVTTIFCTLHLKRFPINMHRTVKNFVTALLTLCFQ